LLVNKVMEHLNTGHSISDLEQKLDISMDSLILKLKNSCVIYDEENNTWFCNSNDPEKVLNRDITKPIRGLKVDKKHNTNPPSTINKELASDKEYELFISYRNVNHAELTEKKSIFLKAANYDLIKSISRKNSFKINGLIHVLLEAGLESYILKDKNRE
jgi:hypothetical protein